MGNQCNSCNSCVGESKLEFNDDEAQAMDAKLGKNVPTPTGKYQIH